MSKKRGIEEEREFANLSCNSFTHCERVAGSGSRLNAVCDAVLFGRDYTALFEIKTIRDSVFYVRKDVREQLMKLYDLCCKFGKVPVLAVKFKYKGWYFMIISESMPNSLRPADMEIYGRGVLDEKINSKKDLGVYGWRKQDSAGDI